MIPDRAPLVVADAWDVVEHVERFRFYWHPLRDEIPGEFRLRAAAVLGRVPSWARLAEGLLRIDAGELSVEALDPVEEDLARRIVVALVDDGWLDLGLVPADAVVASIEASGAIQSTRPAP